MTDFLVLYAMHWSTGAILRMILFAGLLKEEFVSVVSRVVIFVIVSLTLDTHEPLSSSREQLIVLCGTHDFIKRGV